MSILLLFLLIFLTSFFVASEFAIVKVRESRIRVLAAKGDKKARNVKKILENLDEYLSACQLGITIIALGLGWIGEPIVNTLISPLLKVIKVNDFTLSMISYIISFSIIVFFHVVLGELVPKIIAIQKAERISFLISKPLIIFYRFLYPLIWLLNGTALNIVKLLGITKDADQSESHSEEEIKYIVKNSKDINADEKNLVANVFKYDEKKVKEIMVKYKDIDFLYLDKTLEENRKIAKKSMYSRFPVIEKKTNKVKGYLNIRDIHITAKKQSDISKILRDIPMINEDKPIKVVLNILKTRRTQIAIICDDLGNVKGLVSVEDIIEEIVGDIQDEFDS